MAAGWVYRRPPRRFIPPGRFTPPTGFAAGRGWLAAHIRRRAGHARRRARVETRRAPRPAPTFIRLVPGPKPKGAAWLAAHVARAAKMRALRLRPAIPRVQPLPHLPEAPAGRDKDSTQWLSAHVHRMATEGRRRWRPPVPPRVRRTLPYGLTAPHTGLESLQWLQAHTSRLAHTRALRHRAPPRRFRPSPFVATSLARPSASNWLAELVERQARQRNQRLRPWPGRGKRPPLIIQATPTPAAQPAPGWLEEHARRLASRPRKPIPWYRRAPLPKGWTPTYPPAPPPVPSDISWLFTSSRRVQDSRRFRHRVPPRRWRPQPWEPKTTHVPLPPNLDPILATGAQQITGPYAGRGQLTSPGCGFFTVQGPHVGKDQKSHA